MDLTHLPEPRANRKTVLKLSVSGQLVHYHRKVPRGYAPPTLGSVSVEAIQGTSEIFIFADINGEVSQLVRMADLEPSMAPSRNFLS